MGARRRRAGQRGAGHRKAGQREAGESGRGRVGGADEGGTEGGGTEGGGQIRAGQRRAREEGAGQRGAASVLFTGTRTNPKKVNTQCWFPRCSHSSVSLALRRPTLFFLCHCRTFESENQVAFQRKEVSLHWLKHCQPSELLPT